MLIYQVDAFADQMFKGNPAGVCVLPPDKMKDDLLLQNIAMEMNLSETVFLSKQNEEYELRWFTPETEINFCGHATLAAAHILWETGLEKTQDTIVFDTLSGKLFANYRHSKIELNFPLFDVTAIPDQENVNLALGIKPTFTGISQNKYLIEVETDAILKAVSPDYRQLKEIDCMAFMITCKSDDRNFDFYSRFFAPALGIDEDPVTGSSHSSLAPYWSKKLGKTKVIGYQLSKRGGLLECEVKPNNRVLVTGKAITVFKITLMGQ